MSTATRPPHRPTSAATLAALPRMRELHRLHGSYEPVAQQLNREGLRTAHGNRWTGRNVRQALVRHGAL